MLVGLYALNFRGLPLPSKTFPPTTTPQGLLFVSTFRLQVKTTSRAGLSLMICCLRPFKRLTSTFRIHKWSRKSTQLPTRIKPWKRQTQQLIVQAPPRPISRRRHHPKTAAVDLIHTVGTQPRPGCGGFRESPCIRTVCSASLLKSWPAASRARTRRRSSRRELTSSSLLRTHKGPLRKASWACRQQTTSPFSREKHKSRNLTHCSTNTETHTGRKAVGPCVWEDKINETPTFFIADNQKKNRIPSYSKSSVRRGFFFYEAAWEVHGMGHDVEPV